MRALPEGQCVFDAQGRVHLVMVCHSFWCILPHTEGMLKVFWSHFLGEDALTFFTADFSMAIRFWMVWAGCFVGDTMFDAVCCKFGPELWSTICTD